MLDSALLDQLAGHFARLTHKVSLVITPAAPDSPNASASAEMIEMANEVAAQSDQITVTTDGTSDRRPAFSVVRDDQPEISVAFAGLPMGHEFTSFILAVLQVGGVAPTFDDAVVDQIRGLDGDFEFETYVSLSCQNCPDVVQALNAMSVINPRVRHTMIDGALFQDEVEAKGIKAVPNVYLNGAEFDQGRMTIDQILAKVDTGGSERIAAELDGRAPYDVLVVGGGPAGSAAAIYTARKGLRTAIVAENIGGQVLDTMSIENLISVSHTEGPRLAADLEAHIRDYEVDIITGQRAAGLVPAGDDGLHRVTLESGATLKSRTVVIATGARWRQMGVPGEDDYRNKGVTFCPHCDGPLFAGKRVAVIGGGNSGVEAAIDLAGVVDHVTLLEFLDEMRADEVLQAKLDSLANTKVILSAATSEVIGDGDGVTGLTYTDRVSGESHQVDLEGIFVQIGLMPNTDWLTDSVALSPRGEIEIDVRGATSVPGVFAAGDVTTVPYKQIVISLGSGATAALSAFDYLIRTAAPV